MVDANLLERVRQLIAKQLQLDIKGVQAESKIEALTADSIQLFELILAFEKEFKAEADYTELMEIETVEDVVEYLQKKKLGVQAL